MTDAPQDVTAILRKRAIQLAHAPVDSDISDSMIELIEFRLGAESYAIEQSLVQGVHPLRDLTPLPGTPKFILGIVNIRGQVLPVLDIKPLFELPDTGLTERHLVIVVAASGATVGLLSESICGVRSMSPDLLFSSMPTLVGLREDFSKGVMSDHVMILDVVKILGDPRIIVDEDVKV